MTPIITNGSGRDSVFVLPKVSSEELLIESIPQSKIKFVHFELSNVPRGNGIGLGLRGRIPMMRPPEFYKIPDPHELEAGVKFVEEWMLENKVVRKHETKKRANTREIAQDLFILAVACFPEENLLDERFMLGVTGIQLIFVIDDIIEETNLLGRNQSMGATVLTYIDMVSKGNHEFNPDDSMFPVLRPAMKAAQKLAQKSREFLVEMEPDLSEAELQAKCEPFAKAVKETYQGVYLLQLAETNERDHESVIGEMSEDTFTFLRSSDAAGLPSIEIGLLHKQINFTSEIRENLFFKRCLDIVQIIIGHQNDLLGLEKDIKNDEWNIVMFKIKKEGLSLQDAFQAVVDNIEKLILDFEYLEAQIRKMYPENGDIDEFFEIVYSILDANGWLLLYTERHGDLRTAFTKLKG